MSTDSPGEDPNGAPGNERRHGRSATTPVSGVLQRTVGRIAADPRLALPFVVAGVVLTAVDLLRVRDPVPTPADPAGDATLVVAYRLFPTGFRATGLRPAALVDLELPYLAWAVGVELAAFLAIVVAGWLTLSRAAGVERTRGRLASYLGFAAGVHLLLRAFALFDGLAAVTLVALVAYAVVAVKLFVSPAMVVAGDDVRTAVRRSNRRSVGEGTTVLGLVVALGLAGWLLASVPLVGTFLGTAVVAPVHAVATVVLAEATEPSRER